MQALCSGYGLVEGPVWDSARGLLFADVLVGGVFCLDATGGVSTVFEHRRGIGGMALHVAGGLIVSGRNISFKPFGEGDTQLVLDRDPESGNVGYNDLTTDAKGRIYAGSLGSSPVFDDGLPQRAGKLWMIDLDGSARAVADDILLTNGLGFSPDGRTLYHSDSRRQTVNKYAVNSEGSLGAKQTFVKVAKGVPDGLVVSEDGAVWVALAGEGHGVAVFEPSGKQREFIEIPTPMCTSVCFGGNDLQDLYIVSGSQGSGSERGGAVYRVRTKVAGLPVAPARVKLSA
ncbi:MAG: SMP-30/gluconolactonase/LRE family protein [Gammaproteobacteria bacterium]|nr:SMP-30/gluconolactonase/LRE family protein [Gammaproteobacteria bacterium]